MHRISMLLSLLGLAWSSLLLANPPIAFIDVNIVPMDEPRILHHQSVIVRDDLFERIGPIADVQIPADAQRIEGRGSAYLLHGLADMHVHVSARDDFGLYVVNGVTTVLHMGGELVGNVGDIKKILDSGVITAPHVYFALMVDGDEGLTKLLVDTPARAHSVIGLAKANGYDFIKVYNAVSEPVFNALVAEGRNSGKAIIGHGVRAVGLPKALFEGQVMVAHAEEFYYTAFSNHTDRTLIPGVVAETHRSGAYVTPNLSAFEAITKQWGRPPQLTAYLQDPRTAFMSGAVRTTWINSDYVKRSGDLTAVLAFLREFTMALQTAGVPLLAGTDSPGIPGMFPGFSIHDDLRTLVESGLSTFQALSAATRTPGEFIMKTVPKAQRFGVVTENYRADLILVSRNPLEDLQVLKSPLGVLCRGRWYESAQLSELLEERKAKYAVSR